MDVHEDASGECCCEHGVALDVHCCGCHSGFLFDVQHCTCLADDDQEEKELMARGRPIVDFSTSGAQKRVRERERRAAFTPEQKAAALAHQNLYMQHRRLTDVEYLAKVRRTNRVQYAKHRPKRIAAMQDKHWRTRLTCLQAYGGAEPFCGCCGESTLEFLTLDHIEDRRSDGGVRVGGDRVGQVLYSWLIRMKFPEGFRVRCFNCNCARGNRGYCPHELVLDEAVERMAV